MLANEVFFDYLSAWDGESKIGTLLIKELSGEKFTPAMLSEKL